MSSSLESMQLWQSSLGGEGKAYKNQKEILKVSLNDFREKVSQLLVTLRAELPGLTVHDVTHLDALWRVAYVIGGKGLKLNPAEAYVFGGAVLLHDAAHVVAAYQGGMGEIKDTVQWKDYVAQKFGGKEPVSGTSEEKLAAFQVLRHLHAEQAQKLPNMKWRIPAGEELFLIQNAELRSYYGDLIGKIASSHHWSPERVVEEFKNRIVACPGFLHPADWQVDALKIAFLLRCADAAHLDDQRAPWFLFALHKPEGISLLHWQFQAKIGQPSIKKDELVISSGSAFTRKERAAWWLAFDTAKMIDKELRNANSLLLENGRMNFAAKSVMGIDSPESFAKHVGVSGWEPINVGPTVGDIPNLIKTLGGAALYGSDKRVPLRELLQNAMDAIRALRRLGGLSDGYGEINVGLDWDGLEHAWLTVSDNGIGMSRYVLTNVLLDFGNSLWRSDDLREELPGLAMSGFESAGKFGIGFFSVFMLSDEVKVTSKRFEQSPHDASGQWQLVFESGLSARPLLAVPETRDKLVSSGTTVAVKLRFSDLIRMLRRRSDWESEKESPDFHESLSCDLCQLVSTLCPASDVLIKTRFGSSSKSCVEPNDWLTVSDEVLLERTRNQSSELFPLLSSDGTLLGRLGVSLKRFFSQSAVVAVKGIAGGQIQELTGLVTSAGNNEDAQRINAFASGTIEDWQRWAALVAKSSKLNPYSSRLLHPLLPAYDFRVWTIGWRDAHFADVREFLSEVEEILVYEGTISHEDDDDMSSSRFDSSFEPLDNVVSYPRSDRYRYEFPEGKRRLKDNSFPWVLGVDSVNYSCLLESSLKEIWGEVEVFDEDRVVGEADGADITRSVIVYRRG